MGVMGALVMIGAGGFFAAALSAAGVFKLSSSVEWPAGYVSGVMTTADGKYVVPLVPAGRVQLYDAQWHFLRGWNVDAQGGNFKVKCPADGTIEVLTARGQRRYIFTQAGQLLSNVSLSSDEYSSNDAGAQSVAVPTSLLLSVFSSPFLSWAVGVIGMIGMVLVRKRESRKTE